MTPRTRDPSGLTLEVDASGDAAVRVEVGFRTKGGVVVEPE